mmetsp:Transcript_2446/g.4880  ORF Transcript_2446/g.4880 Transcript_2446/m.4880 type:complete len:194 (-) Transcript_2446:21-602(-)
MAKKNKPAKADPPVEEAKKTDGAKKVEGSGESEPVRSSGVFVKEIGPGQVRYDGEWLEVKLETGLEPMKVQDGEGKLECSHTRESFVGSWKLGNMSNGTYSFGNGDVYSGAFNETGRFHGEGSLKWANGNTYSGSWKDGKMHGSGALVLITDNTVWEGKFDEGQFIGTSSTNIKFIQDPKTLPPTLRHLLPAN